jgi:hypothetical protein
MGGGERNLGDIGQRGPSLSSVVTEGFRGVGVIIDGSDVTACKCGMDVADNALCVAAADGGLVVLILAEREGLTS